MDDLIDALIDELNSRGGFDHWWDSLDEDIQSEIREALATRARDYIRVHGGPG